MKAYYLLAPLCAALLTGCAYRPVTYTPQPATVAYASTTYVAPAPYTVVLP
jgi:hypothetical protein